MAKGGSSYFFLWDVRHGIQNTFAQGPNCTARFSRAGALLGTCPGPPNLIWTWTERGGVRALGTLPAGALVHDFNSDGQVVGEYPTAAGTQHAFVWSPGSGFVDLDPDHPTRPSLARFINDDGLIAGEFGVQQTYYNGGWVDAVVWKPVKDEHGESRH
jgi:probable HAF family extracellular repeat protein